MISISLMGMFYILDRIFIRRFLLYTSTSTMLISVFKNIVIKEDGWRLPLDNTFILWLIAVAYLFITLPPAQKILILPYNKWHNYTGEMKCLSNDRIIQKCWDRFSLNLEDIFGMVCLKNEFDTHFWSVLGSAAKKDSVTILLEKPK